MKLNKNPKFQAEVMKSHILLNTSIDLMAFSYTLTTVIMINIIFSIENFFFVYENENLSFCS